jgi:UDP-N-acetylmuramate dehydrogenase
MDIQHHYELTRYNTFGIRVYAKYFIDIQSVEQLSALLKEPWIKQEKLLVLGGGSNLLFTQDFDGLVIKISIGGVHVVKEDDQFYWVKVGAGVNWHELVQQCVRAGFAGLENLSLIPGTVGAAPIQNIGAYGVEVRDYIEAVEAYHIITGNKHYFLNIDMQFGYRDSAFKRGLRGQYIITHVAFRLLKTPRYNTSYGAIMDTLSSQGVHTLTLQAVSDAVVHIRQTKLPDPATTGNAGSFFKNPVLSLREYQKIVKDFPAMPGYEQPDGQVKVAAGWLIEQCGWKGRKMGAVGVHDKQALVLVNHGGGTGAEVLQLAQQITDSVQEKFGISLEPEVNVV